MNSAVKRQDFLKRLAVDSFVDLYEQMPDVSFFMKDRDYRFVALNRCGCEFCGVANEREALGRTDHDFFPSNRADVYMADDRKVIETGRAIFNRLEPAPEMAGSPRLVVTHKVPLFDRKGQIMGLAGFSRRVEDLRGAPAALNQLAKTVEMLHRDHAVPLSSAEMAKNAGLSISQLERNFRKALGTSPRSYLRRVRIEHACRLLSETSDNISVIAQHCGFYDHAHFTRSFVTEKHVTPSRFRKERQNPRGGF